MKVFGQFKCTYCKGTGIDYYYNPAKICRACCGTGISHYRQEYRDGNLLLETCLCNRKGPHRKKYKWCVEVSTLDLADGQPISHLEKNGHKWVWCHDYEYDAWSGSLQHAYKKALKNGKKALARRSSYLMHNMIMRLLLELAVFEEYL